MIDSTLHKKNIVILTGAGISAESGIKTFRDSNGLWEDHRIEDVASPEGFKRDPETVYKFYNARRRQLMSNEVAPNAGHEALARLCDEYTNGIVTLVTQNVDDLHERSGCTDVLHMHGELLKTRCLNCGDVYYIEDDFDGGTICTNCQTAGGLRPDIVWFGEMPFYMDQIETALSKCDIFVAIGTSGQVYPAAGFVNMAAHFGAETHEFNLDPTSPNAIFDHGHYGPAGTTLPKWVDSILAKALN